IFSFSTSIVFNTLLSPGVEFDPYTFTFIVDHAVSMATEAMHVSETFWNTAVCHDDCYLVKGLRQGSPEVPVALCIVHVCFRVTFNHVVKAREKFRRSEEHTSELQSRFDLVCRLLLEKKKTR